jgi:periplasmic copper chaperone A
MRNKSSCFAALILLLARPALAHVTLVVPTAPAASPFVVVFRVGHGCGAAPTTALTIALPAGIAGARPQAKAGWTLAIQKDATGRVSAITWQGGSLQADAFDDFAILMRLPAAQGTLLFPATQTCTSGTEHWSDALGKASVHPAPVLTVTPATGAMPGMVMPDGSRM